MSSDAKTVPMNLVIQPNEAGEFPTYEWQPRGGAYFTGPSLVAFGLMLFIVGRLWACSASPRSRSTSPSSSSLCATSASWCASEPRTARRAVRSLPRMPAR